MSNKHKATVFKSVKMLALAAMLTAMSVVIGILCKNFLNFANGLLRVTFENLPVIMAGILFGPLVGALVGAASDLVSYIFSSQALPPNPMVTVGAISVGVVSGVVAKYIVKKRSIKQIIFSAGAAHVVGSMIIKSIGLYQFYNYGVLLRIPLYLVIAPLEILVLCTLFKRRTFRRLFRFLK